MSILNHGDDELLIMPQYNDSNWKGLKKCPFCGSDNVKIRQKFVSYFIFYHACCKSCGAEGPNKNDEKMAAELWNRREGEAAE